MIFFRHPAIKITTTNRLNKINLFEDTLQCEFKKIIFYHFLVTVNTFKPFTALYRVLQNDMHELPLHSL